MTALHGLIYATLLGFGLIQVFLARGLAGNMRELVARGLRAPGRVCEVPARSSPVSGRGRRWTVSFTAADGREGTIEGKRGILFGGAPGPEVSVIYDPEDLENATVERWTEMWMAPTLAAINGGLMVLAALVVGMLHALGVFSPGGPL